MDDDDFLKDLMGNLSLDGHFNSDGDSIAVTNIDELLGLSPTSKNPSPPASPNAHKPYFNTLPKPTTICTSSDESPVSPTQKTFFSNTNSPLHHKKIEIDPSTPDPAVTLAQALLLTPDFSKKPVSPLSHRVSITSNNDGTADSEKSASLSHGEGSNFILLPSMEELEQEAANMTSNPVVPATKGHHKSTSHQQSSKARLDEDSIPLTVTCPDFVNTILMDTITRIESAYPDSASNTDSSSSFGRRASRFVRMLHKIFSVVHSAMPEHVLHDMVTACQSTFDSALESTTTASVVDRAEVEREIEIRYKSAISEAKLNEAIANERCAEMDAKVRQLEAKLESPDSPPATSSSNVMPEFHLSEKLAASREEVRYLKEALKESSDSLKKLAFHAEHAENNQAKADKIKRIVVKTEMVRLRRSPTSPSRPFRPKTTHESARPRSVSRSNRVLNGKTPGSTAVNGAVLSGSLKLKNLSRKSHGSGSLNATSGEMLLLQDRSHDREIERLSGLCERYYQEMEEWKEQALAARRRLSKLEDLRSYSAFSHGDEGDTDSKLVAKADEDATAAEFLMRTISVSPRRPLENTNIKYQPSLLLQSTGNFYSTAKSNLLDVVRLDVSCQTEEVLLLGVDTSESEGSHRRRLKAMSSICEEWRERVGRTTKRLQRAEELAQATLRTFEEIEIESRQEIPRDLAVSIINLGLVGC